MCCSVVPWCRAHLQDRRQERPVAVRLAEELRIDVQRQQPGSAAEHDHGVVFPLLRRDDDDPQVLDGRRREARVLAAALAEDAVARGGGAVADDRRRHDDVRVVARDLAPQRIGVPQPPRAEPDAAGRDPGRCSAAACRTAVSSSMKASTLASWANGPGRWPWPAASHDGGEAVELEEGQVVLALARPVTTLTMSRRYFGPDWQRNQALLLCS